MKYQKKSKLKKGDIVVEIDPNYFRPTEVENLLGDSSKARKILKWNPKYSFDMLVDEMVISDFNQAKKELTLNSL
jgi:GDPmannose 4,6-dehydratase